MNSLPKLISGSKDLMFKVGDRVKTNLLPQYHDLPLHGIDGTIVELYEDQGIMMARIDFDDSFLKWDSSWGKNPFWVATTVLETSTIAIDDDFFLARKKWKEQLGV